MTAKKNTEHIKSLASEMDFSLCGVADIREIRRDFNLDQDLVSRFDRAVSLGKRLLDSVIEDIKDKPTSLYFHHYRQLNFFLDRGAFLLSSRIQEWGFLALPIAASQIIDWENQRSHVSHKKVGQRAGLGWIGRNNLLVNPRLGSRHRLVTILTDMPLDPDEVLDRDCGECVDCLKTCPAKAIQENKEDFDHWACFDKLKEFRRQGIVGQYICGVCVKACKGPK
jgi:epoxyqueuosine reductase